MAALDRFTDKVAPWAPTILRVTLGVIMAYHGYQKLTGMTPAGFGNNMLGGLGVPAPVFFGWVVTVIELVGGIALIIGAATRIAALLNGLVMIGAIALVKVDVGLIAPQGSGVGMELDLALLALAIGVLALGPGKLSVDGATGNEVIDLTVGESSDGHATTGADTAATSPRTTSGGQATR